ncbi:MAG: DUF4384 domain-containing protein [Acidobacteriota bacterium]|nr:DUF4384 domain-containing protein [Acidobacteriota bacterium]
MRLKSLAPVITVVIIVVVTITITSSVCDAFRPIVLAMSDSMAARDRRGETITRERQDAAPQDEDVSVRGAFFATRPGSSKSGNNRASAGTTASGAPKSSTHKSVGRKPTSTVTVKKPAATTASGKTAKVPIVNGEKISYDSINLGLGYTLYLRAANGDAVRVDPDREFSAGDQIRIALETNADGFLYIFHTENGLNPQMLFPDARLNGGVNRVRAHVPYQVPANTTDWFKFDARPASERLYVVLTREPLPGVPVAGALVKHCAGNPASCAWRPTSQLWSRVTANASAPVGVSRDREYGQAETVAEREAVTRGIGLSLDAPPPSIVRMNISSGTNLLATRIDLVHK